MIDNSLHTISFAWNNSAYFKCCWRESTKPLQFFCKTMSIAYLIDQRKMIVWQKLVILKVVCCRPWHILKEISAMRYTVNMVCARTMELTRLNMRYSKILPLLLRCDFMLCRLLYFSVFYVLCF